MRKGKKKKSHEKQGRYVIRSFVGEEWQGEDGEKQARYIHRYYFSVQMKYR